MFHYAIYYADVVPRLSLLYNTSVYAAHPLAVSVDVNGSLDATGYADYSVGIATDHSTPNATSVYNLELVLPMHVANAFMAMGLGMTGGIVAFF